MKEVNITRKISQGMYVLTTIDGGCIVDAVSQISGGDNPLIAVSVMKKNYTNELLKINSKFAISILGEDVNAEIIKTFGFNSMRNINKFEKITETLFNEDETVISISNNKKKSLRRAKYIVNFDFDTEKLIQYSINRTAVIINVNNDMKIENIAFEGICINNINIEIPNEIEKYFDILAKKIDKTTLYVSLLNQKQELERIRTRIKDDNIHILNLIGYNGAIEQKELVRIS